MYINVNSIIRNSRVNGPGERFVIWTQGCRKMCKNCYNPETWSHYKNNLIPIENILEDIRISSVRGVTISGGDPFEQEDELMSLLFLLSGENYKKGIIVFSGYTKEQIEQHPIRKKCLEYMDVLIDGLYIDSLNPLTYCQSKTLESCLVKACGSSYEQNPF